MSLRKTVIGLCLLISAISSGMLIGRGRYLGAEESVWMSPSVHVADGVEYRYIPEGSPLVHGTHSDALVLDVDLKSPRVRIRIAADQPIQRSGGRAFAVAHTVRDWCEKQNALGGINGGFFGVTDGDMKQAQGLLVVQGQVYGQGRWVRSTRKPEEAFVRCALGFSGQGVPHIGWVTSNADNRMQVFDRPLAPAAHHGWHVSSAVACGPRLIAQGTLKITDHEERLMSPSALPRTFVAYDIDGKGAHAVPHHLVMGIAMEMTYNDVATFLQAYFQKQHGAVCAEAMCLDGGSSSQLVFRNPQAAGNKAVPSLQADPWIDTRPSHVSVPTAILIDTVHSP